jgi:hypothetical protein
MAGMLHRFARMGITGMRRMPARRTASTDRIGSLAACLLALDLGSTGFMAVAAIGAAEDITDAADTAMDTGAVTAADTAVATAVVSTVVSEAGSMAAVAAGSTVAEAEDSTAVAEDSTVAATVAAIDN